MPARYISLKMPSYLRDWLIHRHGGSHPVVLMHGSIENKILQRAVQPLPESIQHSKHPNDVNDIKASENNAPLIDLPEAVSICIPTSKAYDQSKYIQITEVGRQAFIKRIKEDFKLDVWNYINVFGTPSTCIAVRMS